MNEYAVITRPSAVASATASGPVLHNVSSRAAFRVAASSPEPSVDAEALSALIGEIYDCTLDPARWPAVLDSCREFIGGMGAAIFSKDLSGADFRVFQHDGRLEGRYAQLYHERYAALDPANAGHLFAEIGEPISTADILDYDEFRQSRFYREWATPQRIVDFVAAPIEKSGSRAVMFGVFRHERDGVVDESTRARMRLVVPHIRRAVLIGKVIDDARSDAASLADAFDGLSVATFLVDATGRVVHANAAGVAMLQQGEPMHARGGRIVSVDREASPALANVIGAAADGDAAVGVRGISIAIESRDGENYVAHVLPLTSGARRSTGSRYAAVAALFVQRASFDMPAPPEVIAKTFGLTPTELRVLVTIVHAGGVAETAEALGVGEATVKTHLHRLFGKTGTSRQAELVKLMAAYASPLAR
jgi:DNA-binding CsgD family transcriptional regulator